MGEIWLIYMNQASLKSQMIFPIDCSNNSVFLWKAQITYSAENERRLMHLGRNITPECFLSLPVSRPKLGAIFDGFLKQFVMQKWYFILKRFVIVKFLLLRVISLIQIIVKLGIENILSICESSVTVDAYMYDPCLRDTK